MKRIYIWLLLIVFSSQISFAQHYVKAIDEAISIKCDYRDYDYLGCDFSFVDYKESPAIISFSLNNEGWEVELAYETRIYDRDRNVIHKDYADEILSFPASNTLIDNENNKIVLFNNNTKQRFALSLGKYDEINISAFNGTGDYGMNFSICLDDGTEEETFNALVRLISEPYTQKPVQ